MMLFIVEERYMLTNIGLALLPGPGNTRVKVGDKIKIVRPDSTAIESVIVAIAFHDKKSLVVDRTIKKEDVPPGSEVWLIQ